MKFQKGNKLGPGRPPGSQNKRSLLVKEKAEELGVDPFEILLLFAKGDWEALGYQSAEVVAGVSASGHEWYEYTISPMLRAKCAMEAVQYLTPKLKSIEHTTNQSKDALTPQQRLEMMKAATQALENEISRLEPGNGNSGRDITESEV